MVERQALIRSTSGSTPDGVPFLYLSFVLLHHAKKAACATFHPVIVVARAGKQARLTFSHRTNHHRRSRTICMAQGRNHTYDANSNSTRSIKGAQTSFSLPENATSKQKKCKLPCTVSCSFKKGVNI